MWDTQRIAAIFTQPQAEMILKIPLPTQAREDQLMWNQSKQGNYTVKSGHHSTLFNTDEASTSNPNTSYIWPTIWEVNTQPRCKEFMWRAAQNAQPVKVKLQQRGISTDLICPLCGEDQEPACHVILTCHEVRAIWFLSPLRLVEGMDFKAWLEHLLSNLPESGQKWLFSLAWAIWKRRNMWVFDEKKLPPDQVILQASRMVIPEAEPKERQ
ncbi:uncharacterized protein LOC130744068 [Lotus japonicus]|uniref:uncharacterized protein LOC130744068 n=1 Tax=Lotus japonicus TaxID=34305 RepID=UPI00258DC2B0|nr:uncharacterized protein LOC130744068 [Lotus japonicus]